MVKVKILQWIGSSLMDLTLSINCGPIQMDYLWLKEKFRKLWVVFQNLIMLLHLIILPYQETISQLILL